MAGRRCVHHKNNGQWLRVCGHYIGSIPEKGADDKLYNTCTVYDPEGRTLFPVGDVVTTRRYLLRLCRKSCCDASQGTPLRYRYPWKD